MSLKDDNITRILKKFSEQLKQEEINSLQKDLRGIDDEELLMKMAKADTIEELMHVFETSESSEAELEEAPNVSETRDGLEDEVSSDFDSDDREVPASEGLRDRLQGLVNPRIIVGGAAVFLIAAFVAVSYFGSQPIIDTQSVEETEVLVEQLDFPETDLVPAGPNGGIVYREAWITTGFVGISCYTAVDLNENSRSGEVLTGDKMYTVVEVVGKRSLNNNQVFAVETPSGVCYLPAVALNLETAPLQVANPSELRRIVSAVASLEPTKIDVRGKIEGVELNIVLIAATVLVVALLTEKLMRKDLSQLLLIIPILLLLQHAQELMSSVDGFVTIHILGILVFLGLGYERGSLARIYDVIFRVQSDSSFTPPKELSDLLPESAENTFQNVLRSANWSLPIWWIGLNIAMGILYPWNSGLFVAYGAKIALFILVAEFLFLTGLDSFKRGEKSDLFVFLGSLFLGAVVLVIMAFGPALGVELIPSVLGVSLAAVVIIVFIAASGGNDMIEKDRIPDSIGWMSQSVIIAVLTYSIYFTP